MFSHWLLSSIRLFAFSAILMLISSPGINAQTTGSYRTIASGDWNDPGVWEYYNGTAWTSATVINDGNFSSGWTNVQVGGTNAFTVGANSGLNGVGDAGISITGISQAWYYKAVTLLAGQTYSLNFDYVASTNDATNKRIGVAIRNTPPTTAQIVNLGYTGATYFFNSLVASTSWVTRGFGQPASYLTDFTPGATGTYYLAIGVNQLTNTTINLDNIVLRAIPSSASAAINIRNGHTVEINNSITIDQTTIDAGGTLELKAGTITLNSSTGTDLQINGTYRRSAATSISIDLFATIVVGNGGTYDHNFAGGIIPPATWDDGSMLQLSLGTNAGGLDQSFYNVLVKDGISVLSNDNIDRTMTVRNDMRIEGGTFWMKGGDNGGIHVLTILGNFFHSKGVYGFNINNENQSEIRIRIGKDWIISGTASWAGEIASTSPTGTTSCNSGAYFIGTGEQTFSTVLPHDVGDLRNRFYVASTVTALNEKYLGTAPQYTINGSGGVCPVTTISGFSSWPTSGNLLKTFTINNPAGVLLRDNRNIKDTLYRTNGSITADPGDATVEVISYSTGATLEYNGNSEINTEDMEFPTTNGPTNLNINNPGSVTLHASRSLNGKLIFSVENGLLNTTSCNATTTGSAIITLNDGATATGAGNKRFVNGIVTKIGYNVPSADPFTYPIGEKNGSVYKYAPIQIKATNASHQYSACYVGSNPTTPGYNPSSRDGSLTSPTEYKVSTCEYWHINKGSGSNDVPVTLSWGYGRSCAFADALQLIVTHWDTDLSPDAWNNRGNNGANTAGPPVTFGWVTSAAAISKWGTFTLAHPALKTVTLNNSVLNLRGRKENNSDILEWNLPPDCFLANIFIECSSDGKNYRQVGQLIPDNRNIENKIMRYERTVNEQNKRFYRLKILQPSTAKYFYSNTIQLNSSALPNLQILPNPATDKIILTGNTDPIRQVIIFNQMGQAVFSMQGSGNIFEIPVSNLQKGLYNLRVVSGNNQTENLRFIKQ